MLFFPSRFRGLHYLIIDQEEQVGRKKASLSDLGVDATLNVLTSGLQIKPSIVFSSKRFESW